jgi:hypothetical protein
MATQGGHDHTIDIPVVLGPMVLKVALLAAVCAVTGFALMRAFLGEPNRRTVAWLTGCAAGAALVELLLAGPLAIPEQTVPLILAGLAAPVALAVSEQPALVAITPHARRVAPWIVALTSGFALAEFGRAWLAGPTVSANLLHTGLIVALVGLSWFTLGVPRARPARAAVYVVAGIAAAAAFAGAAQATALA